MFRIVPSADRIRLILSFVNNHKLRVVHSRRPRGIIPRIFPYAHLGCVEHVQPDVWIDIFRNPNVMRPRVNVFQPVVAK